MKEFCKYPIHNRLILIEISNSKGSFNFIIWYKDLTIIWIRKSYVGNYFELEMFGRNLIYFKCKQKPKRSEGKRMLTCIAALFFLSYLWFKKDNKKEKFVAVIGKDILDISSYLSKIKRDRYTTYRYVKAIYDVDGCEFDDYLVTDNAHHNSRFIDLHYAVKLRLIKKTIFKGYVKSK